MDGYDIVKLQNIAYVNSQIASFYAELEAMKSENSSRERRNYSPAYVYDDFVRLIDKYQLGHNNVITNLNSNL